jgi:hypothetical protein
MRSPRLVSIPDLALIFARKLRAVPHPHPPARAIFTGGEIAFNEREICVLFDGIGAFFVSVVAGRILVESVAFNNDEPREVVRARHDELERRSNELFGDDNIERLDPLGLRGGAKAVAS